jgi:hypothetical protein
MAPELPTDTAAFQDVEHRGWEQSASAYHQRVGPVTRLTIGPLLDAAAVAPGRLTGCSGVRAFLASACAS